MPFLRKYASGSGADVYVPIIKRGVVDFAVGADWTPANGDVKISIDGGSAANIGTLPVAVAMGNAAYWKFVFSDAELTGKKIIVTVADSATKAVEDQAFIVETFGHASALFPTDYSVASTAQTGDSYARIGANGAGLTALGDTRLAELEAGNLPTDISTLTAGVAAILDDTGNTGVVVASGSKSGYSLATEPPTLSDIVDGVLDAAQADHDTAGSIGAAIGDAGSAGDPWEAPVRTLTTAVSGVTVPDGAAIIIRKADKWSHTFTNVTTSGWIKLIFTVKRSKDDLDSEALVQIVLTNPGAGTDGLKYLNGAAGTAGSGSITVNSATSVSVDLKSGASKSLPETTTALWYDLKKIVSADDDATTLQESTATITGSVTDATS